MPTQKKAWLGQWTHQYPFAQNAGRDDMYLTLHRWFDHTLKGIPNGIDQEPVVDVQDSLGRWRHEDAWPPADATPVILQIGADGKLVESGAEAGSVAVGGPRALVAYATKDGSSAVAFESDALAEGMHIAGSPWLDLTLASDRPAGTIVARLWDGERQVSQGAYNLLYAGGLASPQPLSPGAPVSIAFALYPTDWAVEPGGALRLTLETQDPRNWFDVDVVGATLTLDAGETALLTLPTIARGAEDVFLVSCGEALDELVEGCWLDLEDKGVEG